MQFRSNANHTPLCTSWITTGCTKIDLCLITMVPSVSLACKLDIYNSALYMQNLAAVLVRLTFTSARSICS